ncbi:hypothetical protein ACFIJ5_15110 [Haloimpatiens sp. FM7330]|uniref:hypothetical protein n=1 Tax=Haloimpatiens sp. FM7330 TaxID=3298610 RepID=UPI003632F6DB
MAYNIVDIIDRVMCICEKRLKVYLDIKRNQIENTTMKLVTNVFINQEKNKIKYYEKFKSEIVIRELREIDFHIYDKISSLMTQFNYRINCTDISSVDKIVHCSLEMDKDILALFIDIRGRLVVKKEDSESLEYEILTNIIEKQEKYIKDLEKMIRIK